MPDADVLSGDGDTAQKAGDEDTQSADSIPVLKEGKPHKALLVQAGRTQYNFVIPC